jgi:predicted Rossmann-fold nucleotide-binding protein
MNRICVFCASSTGHNKNYEKAAFEVGKLLAESNIDVVYGGGNVGLMGTVANAVK